MFTKSTRQFVQTSMSSKVPKRPDSILHAKQIPISHQSLYLARLALELAVRSLRPGSICADVNPALAFVRASRRNGEMIQRVSRRRRPIVPSKLDKALRHARSTHGSLAVVQIGGSGRPTPLHSTGGERVRACAILGAGVEDGSATNDGFVSVIESVGAIATRSEGVASSVGECDGGGGEGECCGKDGRETHVTSGEVGDILDI